jgi:hypothetical protein
VFVVSHKDEYQLTAFIEKGTYAILHTEYENNQEETLMKKRGLESKFVNLKRVIDFKPYDGKYYLNYITVESKVNWYDVKTKELKFETELSQSLLINEVFPTPDRRITATEKMKNYGLQYQDQPYNKEFWDNYNVIKESPVDRKVIEDLEKHGALDKQFKDN